MYLPSLNIVPGAFIHVNIKDLYYFLYTKKFVDTLVGTTAINGTMAL